MEQQVYELPEGWEWRSLSSVTNVVGGGTPKTKEPEYWGGDVVWLSPTDLPAIGDLTYISDSSKKITEKGLAKSSARLVPAGTVVYSTRATIGKIAIADRELATNQGFTNFICSDHLYNRYLAYVLVQQTPAISSLSNSTTFKEVSKTNIKGVEIPIAPLNEQKRIVAKLDALFIRIDAAITHLQETLELSKALFASALDGAFRECEAESVSLTEVVDFIGGSQPPKAEFSKVAHEGYVRLIQIRDYKTDAHIVYVNAKSTKKFCNADDVMIGRYGPPVFQILRGLEGAYNVALMKASPNESLLSKDFLYWFLQSPSIQDYIVGLSQRAAGQSGVNKKALEKYEIPLPSLEEQAAIIAYLGALAEHVSTLEAETQERLDQLTTLKSSLLDTAFRGQL